MKVKILICGLLLTTFVCSAQLPPNAIVITEEDLEKGVYDLDLFSILTALSLKTGITFKSSSDVGAEDWLLIRGIPRDSSRVVLVLVDGMPINDPFSEAVEFEHLPPIDMIEKIIIYKQPVPSRFGGYHAVVEIFTKNYAKNRRKIEGAVGNYGTVMSSLNAEGSMGSFSYIFTTEFLETDNLTGVRRTPPKEGEIYGSRYYRKTTPVVKLNYKFTKNTLTSLYLQYVDSTKFFSDIVFRGERENRKRYLTKLNINHTWNINNWTSFNINLFRRDESYNLNLIMHPDVTKQIYLKQGVRTKINIRPFSFIRVSMGGEFTDMSVLFRDSGTKSSMQFYGAFFENTLNLPFNTLLKVGARYDNHSEAEEKTSPFTVLQYNFNNKEYIYAMYGKNVRWPSLSEFSAKNPTIGLQAEESESAEAGIVKMFFNRLLTRFSIFKINIYGYPEVVIDMSKTPPDYYLMNSDSKIVSEGIESEISFNLTKTTNIFINHTYNSVRNFPEDKPENYGGPKNLLNLGISHSTEKLTFFTSLRYGDSAEGVQRMFGKPTKLSPYTIVDLALKVKLTESTDFLLRIGNLLDIKYETFEGRPMFRRTIIAGFSSVF